MSVFRTVLCPTDFSEFSRHALDNAVAVGRSTGASVTALHVVVPRMHADPVLGVGSVVTTEDLAVRREAVERARERLDSFVEDEIGDVHIERIVLEGQATRTIVDCATERAVDLLVMGTHGRSGFERLLLGSVTESVLRRARCPVLTVPPRVPDAIGLGTVVFGRVLCAVDFSPVSTKVLEYAKALASESGGRLSAVHVIEPLPVYDPVIAGGGGFVNYEELAVAATKTRLASALPKDVDVHQTVAVGKPYRVILDRARDEGSDVIVIGVHSGVGDRLGFLGSTTNHIIREARCPVLSVRT